MPKSKKATQADTAEAELKIVTMTMVDAGSVHKLADALLSAAFADAHFILDTSPTKPDVQAAIKANGLPNVTVKPWAWQQDFSAARNELATQAAALVQEIPGPGTTWGIVLDSDERLICPNPQALRSELATFEKDVGMGLDVEASYGKERAFRLPTQARYAGPTHECCIYSSGDTLKNLRFWELAKSHGEHLAKIKRDEAILLKHTKQNPKDPRWWYYLGQTFEALGKQQEAIDAWLKCAKLRGWNEEGAWACFRAAQNLIKKEKYQEAIEVCARGLSIHAGVAELSWLAAVANSRLGRQDQAAYWGRLAVAMGEHTGAKVANKRVGFRDLPALYELPYDILRFTLPTSEGKEQAEKDFSEAKFHRYGGTAEEIALQKGHVPVRWEARNDIGRRIKALPDLAKDTQIIPIENPSKDGYHALNPSICVHEGKLLAVVRTVNYTINAQGSYVIPPDDKEVIKTENYLADVSDKDFSLSNIRKIVDRSARPKAETNVRGYEDMRISSVGKRLFGSATVRDHDVSMPCAMAICELNKKGEIINSWIQASARDEKNWMPIATNDELRFIYSVDPTVIYGRDPKTGICHEVAKHEPRLALDHLRGGSQAIPIPPGEWLTVTHEVVILDDRRRYLHRFVRLDDQFKVTHVSHAWQLRPTLGIEFVAGLAVWKNRLVMSVGLDDRDACFVSMRIEDALQLANEISV